jgi:hypothetical protein
MTRDPLVACDPLLERTLVGDPARLQVSGRRVWIPSTAQREEQRDV